MGTDHRVGGVPLTTVQRLPRYWRVLNAMHAQGREVVSSARLAELLQLEAIQVRKDFGFIGIVGRAKIGFPVQGLIKAIEAQLAWNQVANAVLVGAGHLGQALLGYTGFAQHGLAIRAAFDIAPDRVGERLHGIPIQPMEELEREIALLDARLAILTVSPEAAQDVADRLVRAGIQGLWNFTGVTLGLPETVIVQDQDIAIGLAVLSARLSARDSDPCGIPSSPFPEDPA